MNPIEKLLAAFQENRAACMPYFTLGYPDMETSLEIIQACAENGADLIEVGIPFSDPLADGPTIQHSTQVALNGGTTLASCLAGVETLRQRGVTIPLVLMGYFNPILAYGLDQFVADALSAQANGFIIPDLPPDEASLGQGGSCPRIYKNSQPAFEVSQINRLLLDLVSQPRNKPAESEILLMGSSLGPH